MNRTATSFVQCPCCWEQIEILVDCSIRRQEYTEDCSVCCRPIVLKIIVRGEDDIEIEARTEDE